jgi:tetratricopeptide (TPR) repeat protein
MGRRGYCGWRGCLVWYCFTRELYDEGIDWALQVIRADGPQRVKADLMAGVLYINIGDFEAAERYLNESRRLATEDGQRWELVNVLAFQGGLAIHRGASGDSEAARTLLQEAVELARQEGDERLLTRPLNRLGLVANEEGNYELARDLFLQALVIADRHDFVGGALVSCTGDN